MAIQTIYTGKDSYINQRHHDHKYGSSSLLAIEPDPGWQRKAQIGFDISSAPASADITSVHLHIYRINDNVFSAIGVDINRITDSWDESTITWDDQPAFTTDKGLTGVSLPDKLAWKSYDITDLYKDAKDAGGELGIWIEEENSGDYKGPYNYLASRGYSSGDYKAYIQIEYTDTSPTISAPSWTPVGDFTKLASGAAIDGDTESLMLIATNPDDILADLPVGEAMLQITDADGNIGDAFTVAEYDHFRFDDKEWWVLNIVCYPDCDFIVLADEIAEAKKIPKIGDTVKFAAAIDWHDKEMSSVRWFFGKPPDECFVADDIDWTEFAVGENTDMPSHTFENDDDIEIIFLKVVAVNKSGAVGEYTDLCNTIVNLWKKPAFDENWLIAAFMTYIIPGLAEKFEYLSDLVYDGDAEPTSGGFSLLWSPVEFVMWIAVALTDIAEDILDIIFGEPEDEETDGYSILWSATQFMTWLYKSIAARAEAILDLVFKED